VYRISGRNGSIVWRLGGRTSTFTLTNFNFTFQHDARYVRGSESGSTLTLTLFDNAYNGITARGSDSSSGKVIRINIATRTAELLVQLNFPDPPTTPFLSADGGSVQVLNGGNYFVGWGSNAYVTEHSPNGNCIYVANFGSGSSAASYRAFKGPLQDILAGSQVNDDSLLPDVFAYAHNTSAPTVVYVSWNGDHYTESWSIYGLDSPSGPPTTQQYRVNKSGFETRFTIPTFHRYVAVRPNPNRDATPTVFYAFQSQHPRSKSDPSKDLSLLGSAVTPYNELSDCSTKEKLLISLYHDSMELSPHYFSLEKRKKKTETETVTASVVFSQYITIEKTTSVFRTVSKTVKTTVFVTKTQTESKTVSQVVPTTVTITPTPPPPASAASSKPIPHRTSQHGSLSPPAVALAVIGSMLGLLLLLGVAWLITREVRKWKARRNERTQGVHLRTEWQMEQIERDMEMQRREREGGPQGLGAS
ncbi:MAG: hypothetical protein Q9214_005783, partial [Letrouitia sp. 1 TL-2023]